LLRAAAQQLANTTVAHALSAAENVDDIRAVLMRHKGHAQLEELALLVVKPAANAADSRAMLMELADKVRAIDIAAGGGHTAAADMLLLYACTHTWFTSERDYKVRRIPQACCCMLVLRRPAHVGEPQKYHVEHVTERHRLPIAHKTAPEQG
jgi:hypothetical protein